MWAGKIPEDLDIVLTSALFFAHLDNWKGCQSLLKGLGRVKPALIVFGRIHPSQR